MSEMPRERQTVHYRNAKVVIIGNSDIGKSSLNRALAGEEFLPAIPREKHQIRLLSRQEQSNDDGRQEVRETYIWDPGGRSGYRLTHQLYLDDVAVALILLDTRGDGEVEAGMRDWARAVQRVKSHRLTPLKMFLVITCKDEAVGGNRFFSKIQDLKKDLGFDDVFETSAKEGVGINELREAIIEVIDWEQQPGVCSMALMHQVQQYLSDRKQEGWQIFPEEDLYEAFKKLFTTSSYQDEDPRAQFEACIRCIAAKGAIHRLSTDNYILLQPELRDGYISRLLDEARNNSEGFGCIDEGNARRGRFSLPYGVERVKDRALERILLDSIIDEFLNNKIAFRGHGHRNVQETSLIFPLQSTQKNYSLSGSEQKYYTFHFAGDVIAIYSTLVARLAHSQIFVKEGLWSNAATYTVEADRMCCLFLHMQSETKGSLTLFFDDGVSEKTRKLFAAYVLVHLTSYDRNASGRSILRCPNCRIEFTEEQEKQRRARYKSTIDCPVCETEVQLPDVTESRVGEIRSRKQRRDYDVFLFCDDHELDKRETLRIYDELEKRGIVAWTEERDLPPGGLRLSEIGKQIQQFKVVVICLGNESENSRWLDILMNAFLNEFKRQGGKIIPVYLTHAPREKSTHPLLDFRSVDFRKDDPDPQKQ